MAFRYNEIGRLMTESPAEAFEELAALFDEHEGSRRGVAFTLGVDESTLGRWIKRLDELGHGDPRAHAQRKPRARAAGAGGKGTRGKPRARRKKGRASRSGA